MGRIGTATRLNGGVLLVLDDESSEITMQFHLDGFKPGDPATCRRVPAAAPHTDTAPAQVDVLIVGCGPAGLTLAAQLAAFPDIQTCIVEQKDGPLQLGPGRRRRLPDDGDVRGLRLLRAAARRRPTGSTR